jgi:NYN domain
VAFAFSEGWLRTFIYVDGFNLYNRALIKTQFKWLDLRSLCTRLLDPANQIEEIKYYTARVSGRRDPDQPTRQNAYLRALKTLPGLSIYYGRFLPKIINRPLVKPVPGLPKYVDVHSTEEKGSDVNLASHLIWDGARNAFGVAVVISKDTDLVEPIRIVRHEMGKPVGVLCPDGACPPHLAAVASFVRHINDTALAASQFPSTVRTHTGREIHEPRVW